MTMPALVGPVASEHEDLLADLAQRRDLLRLSLHGLTHEQATATPTISSLSLAGLIKHAADTERRWIAGALGRRELPACRSYGAAFGLDAGETLADVIGFYAAVADETEVIVRGFADLDTPVFPPQWVVPGHAGYWSVRSVLLQVIDETSSHARAADLIRPIIDRTTTGRHSVLQRGAHHRS